ncbi:efflux RND transporter periplasmic adaptor subunit [Candidatus Rhodoblastus alkanivorans]|uniref:Efflux RND transporter periplasmic adaptor subunit n=1 Tax=Candidatus Rhodoblastus alkanivorans TaxID=2954117 RepID=A0ABS9ZAM2_9HYPH|nr:efflux RND transporter periplasmic adaptor subunit [Candidatus Rhodoblastus alkanivorans]MCI4684745.1 efflux RND transporter periplasmic adaptor subunit [Candidatus Rhodoblastus alkanivorans]
MVRTIRLSLVLPLAAVAALAGCKEEKNAPPPPRPAFTMVVEPSAAFDLMLSGTVQPQVQTPVGFRVMGRMISRPVKAGDRVQKGETLAAIDPLSLEMAARTATANLANARAQFDNAAATETRQAALLQKKTTSQASFDTAQQERAAAQANMEQAEANLVKAREQLSYAVVKADYPGLVTATYAEVGQTVSPGQSIVAIAEPSKRDAVIDATENIVDALYIGQKFDVSLQIDPTRTIIGAVREIAPESDSVTRTRRVKIALENPPDSFRIGATIFARLASAAREAIRIPGSALLREGEKARVFVVDPATSQVRLRDVEIAPAREAGRWIVRAGLKAGERIVTAGVHRLKEGEVVKIYGSEAP